MKGMPGKDLGIRAPSLSVSGAQETPAKEGKNSVQEKSHAGAGRASKRRYLKKHSRWNG